MTKAEIVEFIGDLSLSRADADACAVYLDEAFHRMGEVLCDLELVAVTSGTGSYTLEEKQMQIMSVFYGDRQLMETPRAVLEGYKAWRDWVGEPKWWVKDGETEGVYRLVPEPKVSNKDFSYITGEPLGTDWPEYAIGLMYVVFPNEDYQVPDWLVIPLAFEVMAKEFARPSDHQDTEFANACSMFAGVV